MQGVELAAKFSYITNTLRFCGPKEASTQFLDYVKDYNNKEEVTSSLRRFEGLYPYFRLISQKHGLELFDDKVVEAYWVGNDLLKGFSKDDIIQLIQHLTKRGLPYSIANQLIDRLPEGMMPHHNFNVFYVGVGRITASVKTTLHNMNNCRTAWGEVKQINENTLIVETQSLQREQGRIQLSNPQQKKVTYLPEFLPHVKKGDMVALHWDFAPITISHEQLTQLKKYTQLILDLLPELPDT